MLQWLKNHFIPSEANDHQPHFLRIKIIAGVLALVFMIELLYLAGSLIILPTSDYFAAIFASVLVEQTNTERHALDLGTLTVNEKLVLAAQMKADDMATRGYFSHVSPDGKNSWYWFDQVGYNYAAAGENLAVNFTDSKDVTEAWMHSPTHRSNIVGENYTEIGIATAHGIYKGKDAIFVAQMFGRPSLIARQIQEGTTTIDRVGAHISTVNPPEQKQGSTTVVRATTKEITPVKNITETRVENIPTTTVVAGAETTKLSTEDTIADVPPAEPSNINQIGTLPKEPTAMEKIVASPHRATNALYLILAALVTLALGLAIFIKIRIQYPRIISNGLIVIVVIIALLLLNSALPASLGAI